MKFFIWKLAVIINEWPAGCRYWNTKEWHDILKEMRAHAVSQKVHHRDIAVDGCMYGVANREGTPMQKPWTFNVSAEEDDKLNLFNLNFLLNATEVTTTCGQGAGMQNCQNTTL